LDGTFAREDGGGVYAVMGEIENPWAAEAEANSLAMDKSIIGRLPKWRRGQKAKGLLFTGESEISLQSAVKGPAQQIPLGTRGFNAYVRQHVEGHAAAIMRLRGIKVASLYVNKFPCGACAANLERILAPGSRLWLVGPNGIGRWIVGAS
jgi:hypothetical protein